MNNSVKYITGAAIAALGVFFLLRVIASITWPFSLPQLLQFWFGVGVVLFGLSAMRTRPQPAQSAIPVSEPMMVCGATLALLTGLASSLFWPWWILTFIGLAMFFVGTVPLKRPT